MSHRFFPIDPSWPVDINRLNHCWRRYNLDLGHYHFVVDIWIISVKRVIFLLCVYLCQLQSCADEQLNTLVREGLVTDYPPLVDPEPGAMTAQYVSDWNYKCEAVLISRNTLSWFDLLVKRLFQEGMIIDWWSLIICTMLACISLFQVLNFAIKRGPYLSTPQEEIDHLCTWLQSAVTKRTSLTESSAQTL